MYKKNTDILFIIDLGKIIWNTRFEKRGADFMLIFLYIQAFVIAQVIDLEVSNSFEFNVFGVVNPKTVYLLSVLVFVIFFKLLLEYWKLRVWCNALDRFYFLRPAHFENHEIIAKGKELYTLRSFCNYLLFIYHKPFFKYSEGKKIIPFVTPDITVFFSECSGCAHCKNNDHDGCRYDVMTFDTDITVKQYEEMINIEALKDKVFEFEKLMDEGF